MALICFAVVTATACAADGRSAPSSRLLGAPRSLAVEVLLSLGSTYLDARVAWDAGARAGGGDRVWGDLEPMQQDELLASARLVAELGPAFAAALVDVGARDRAGRVQRLAQQIDDRLDDQQDPTADLPRLVGELLTVARGELDWLAGTAGRTAADTATAGCILRRLAVIEAVHDHTAAVDDAEITSEMGVLETGLPPGSPEQLDVEADHDSLVADLERWRGWLNALGGGDLAVLGHGRVATVATPPAVVPEPIADTWHALAGAIAAARAACPAGN